MPSAIGPRDGIAYGFDLLGYVLLVSITGGLLLFLGVIIGSGSAGSGGVVIGVILLLIGFGVVYAGVLGIGYKVIADAVYLGNVAADEHEE